MNTDWLKRSWPKNEQSHSLIHDLLLRREFLRRRDLHVLHIRCSFKKQRVGPADG